MSARKIRTVILASLFLWLPLLLQSCAASLLTIPLGAYFSGVELAVRGGDLYKQMKKADGRKAFELSFEQTWDNTLQALEDLSLEIEKAGKNEDGDGGLIEAKSLEGKIHIAVIKLTESVSEVGVWTKRDHALAELILAKVEMYEKEDQDDEYE